MKCDQGQKHLKKSPASQILFAARISWSPRAEHLKMKILLVFGLAAASVGATAPPSCVVNPREDKCFKGNTLSKPTKVSTWQQCCSACSSQKGCAAYSYDLASDLCSLFTTKPN